MKSVDALRELGSQYHDRIIFFKEEFDKCLDAIEEEGKTRYGTEYTDELYQFARRVEEAANDRDDVTLFGVDYTPLPVDADGVPIHVGDVMEWVRYEDDDPTIVRNVSAVGNGVFFAWSDEQGRYAQYEAHAYRHHHAPTVEDVLREFAQEMNENMGMYTGEAIDADEWRKADERTIAEYAAKLRLAGDE